MELNTFLLFSPPLKKKKSFSESNNTYRRMTQQLMKEKDCSRPVLVVYFRFRKNKVAV